LPTTSITAAFQDPTRNVPREIRLRFRAPGGKPPAKVTVSGRSWKKLDGDWVILPGDSGMAAIVATY
jgi:hypothetical protein